MRRWTVACALIGLLVSCGGDAPTAVETALEGASPTAEAEATTAPSPGEKKTGDRSRDEEDTDPEEKRSPGGSGPETGDDSSGGGGSPSGGPSGEAGGGSEGSSPAGGGGGSGGSSSLAPTSGTYTYSQEGYEEFCTATCDRQKLPRRQDLALAVTDRSAAGATVVTEARSSNGGMTRSTTRYTKASATVLRVYVRFTYSGYTFDETYRPRPPVESLRFPLTQGESWKGSWKGKVSGDYSVRVEGRELVGAGKREVLATKVSSTLEFRGDFQGSANTSVWIDPRTKAIVRSAGNAQMKSRYGSYGTAFATTLESGPGY